MITRFPARCSSLLRIARHHPQGLLTSHEIQPKIRFLTRATLPPCRQARYYSSIPPTTTESPRPSDLRSQFSSSPTPPQPHAPLPKPKRSLRPYIYATFFLIIGLTAGQYMRLVISPPALPPADSKEDKLMVEFLHKQAEKLPIVQSLSSDPSWTSHDAYSTIDSDEGKQRLTTGPLAGARALGGFQRVFTNAETGECVTVVWFGGAISGWPGVTHGGLTATIMDESLGRCAIQQFPSRTGVTANLELSYLKPIVTNSFYVIRTIPQKEGFSERKGWVSGRLETMEGKVCVEAKALFVVPKTFKTKALTGF